MVERLCFDPIMPTEIVARVADADSRAVNRSGDPGSWNVDSAHKVRLNLTATPA